MCSDEYESGTVSLGLEIIIIYWQMRKYEDMFKLLDKETNNADDDEYIDNRKWKSFSSSKYFCSR